MSTEIEFFFDIASPYTYLAATQMDAIHERTGVPVRWRPFLLGGVYQSTGNKPPMIATPAKGPFMLADLTRWAKRYRVPFVFEPSLFPLNSLGVMRAITACPEEHRAQAAKKLFHAYWGEGRNPNSPDVLTECLGADATARASEQRVKDELRATTDEAARRGAFGAPTIFVGSEMFFGNDRLDFVEEAARAMKV